MNYKSQEDSQHPSCRKSGGAHPKHFSKARGQTECLREAWGNNMIMARLSYQS